jgi:hypothetical protein
MQYLELEKIRDHSHTDTRFNQLVINAGQVKSMQQKFDIPRTHPLAIAYTFPSSHLKYSKPLNF